MSIDRTVYIGPYVLCQEILVDVTDEHQTCSNAACINHGNLVTSPYCPECGHASMTVEKNRKTVKNNTHEIYMMLNEVFSAVENFDDGNCCWVCNKENPTHYSYDPCRSSDLSLVYAEEYGFRIEGGYKSGILSPSDGLELFKSMYEAELEKLAEVYGENKIQVLWGILNWAH